MHAIHLSVVFSSLLSLTSATLSKRIVNDPALLYLERMCSPLLSNGTRIRELHLSIDGMISSLANSPYPCEQELYLGQICTANGTTQADFIAEQECMCNGSFFQAQEACHACYYAHGYQRIPPEEAASSLSSAKTAECSPSPPFQPYINIFPPFNITSAELVPSLTLLPDKYFNNTAISVYATVTASLTPGAITGSATARLTTWTNTRGIRYTPTIIPPNNGTGTVGSGSSAAAPSPTSGASTGAGTSGVSSGGASTSSSTTQSANMAAVGEEKFAGGLLAAAVLGIAALL